MQLVPTRLRWLALSRESTLFATLLAAVLLAGCTVPAPPGQGQDTGSDFRITPNDGLTLSFGPATATFQEGQNIVLELSAENTGEHTIEDGTVSLYGASFLNDDSCQRSGSISGLQQVVESAQQVGGQGSVIWECDYPETVDLGEGVLDTFPAGIDVTYPYRTTATGSFTLIPESQFSGGSSAVSVENSAAPVHASVSLSSPRPVPADATTTIPLLIDITNVGDGHVTPTDEPVVTLTAALPDAPSGISVNDACKGADYRLVQGSRTVTCEISVEGGAVAAQTTYRMEISLDYGYEETLESSFSIRGLPGSPN